jgi:dTDP-glucose 4,6-dehydratase
MPTTLITGGAGFLGSHLCDRLIAEGHRVICVDNFQTGRRENISHLLSNSSFTLIEHDVTQPLKIKGDIDYILHFASPASPKDYMQYAIETMKTGALGTNNMLELAKQKGSVFLLASTSEVYGDPQIHPQPENYWGYVNPIGPRSVYDEAKRYAEALTMAYHREYGLNVKIVRIFNTYGPRMKVDDGRVVSNFIVQALRGEPITVYGDGSQKRSFCYVSDLMGGILRLMQKNYVGVVNLGNPEEYTVLKLAEIIKELTGSSSEIVFRPLPQDDPKQRQPDISLAKKLLNWEPKISLREGLERTIAYFREIMQR